MKIRARIILFSVLFASILGGVLAEKSQAKNKRAILLWFVVDSLNPNPAQRLCTKPTMTAYTSVEADKAPGAPTLIQNAIYFLPVLASVCPTVAVWVAL